MLSRSYTAVDRNPRQSPDNCRTPVSATAGTPALQNVARGGSGRDLPDRLPMSIRRARVPTNMTATPNAESGALARVSRYRKEAARQRRTSRRCGAVGLRVRDTSRSCDAHCAGVLGWMFLLLWNTFSGSYFAFTSASRR